MAFIAQNDVDKCTAPAWEVKDFHSLAEEDEQNDSGVVPTLFDNDFEGFGASVDSDSESILEERCQGEDLPGCDSHSLGEQFHVMLGGDLRHNERSQAAGEDDEMRLTKDADDEDKIELDSHDDDDKIELDSREEAMLDLLQLCQDAGTSLQFFDELVKTLRWHGKKGFDVRKASKRQTFLDNLRKKITCPRPEIV
jgi:hypothetical protein